MILLALLCLSLGYSFALPTTPNTPTDTLFSFFTRRDDKFDTRSTLGVFWSCLSTIFTCTWIAIHPNIPGPKESHFRRRMALMGYALIAPEIMILWAVRQHRAARYLSKRHKERGWTMAHGFFLIMGGFTLHDKRGTALRILECNELDTLSKAGKIAWPSITKEEIQDRSKGDYLSKGIVVVQIGWFIIQFIARCAYRLGITELEMVTFAFTLLTGATYYLWWHKPLDVHCSVPVYLLENENVVSECILSGSPAVNPLSDLAHPGTSCEPIEGLETTQVHFAPQFLINEESGLLQQPLIVSPLDPDPSPRRPNPSNAIEPPSHNNSTATSDSDANALGVQMRRSVASIQKKYGVLMLPVITLYTALIDAASSHTLDHSVPLCVPTFYSPKVDDTISDIVVSRTSGVGAFLVSGLILTAISFFFAPPSAPEQTIWFTAFTVVVVSASLLQTLAVLVPELHLPIESTRRRKFWVAVAPAIVPVLIATYVCARITFLILAFIELRALSPTKLIGIEWTSFFPHIG